MDEQEKLERLREIRLIVTEILMFLAVVALVGFLTLIVTGHSFNLKKFGSEGEMFERTGLVQISSVPTGATIAIDGEIPLMLRTNGSRTMLTGEHTVKLSKDGYDTWEKTITVTEGLMYRINYPRLFLKEREREEVFEFENLEYVTVSPNKEKMLVVEGGKTYLIDLNSAKPTQKLVFDGVATNVKWSGNSERVLAKIEGEWTVLLVKNAAERLAIGELVKKVDAEFEITDLKFESEAGERLLVLLSDGTLREVDVRQKILSEPIAKKVKRFDNDGDRIVYVTQTTVDGETQNQTRVMRVGMEESTLIALAAEAEAKVLTMRYFQDTYFGVVDDEKLNVYYAAAWPETELGVEKIFEETLESKIEKFEKRGKGMVFAMEGVIEEERYAEVFDIEAMQLTRFVLAGATGWVDEYLRYAVSENGELAVMDYDGLNYRVLVKDGADVRRAVTISGNGKYLYYFMANGKLVREKVN